MVEVTTKLIYSGTILLEEKDFDAKLACSVKKAKLAKLLREKVKQKFHSRVNFAKALNKKPSEITRFLKGDHNLKIETLFKIEEVLGVELIKLSTP